MATLVAAQFNSTIEIALDNLSPSFDTGFGDRSLGPWWVYDSNTGFFQSSPASRSSGGLDVCFVAQGNRVSGEAIHRPERSPLGGANGSVGTASFKESNGFGRIGYESNGYGRIAYGPADGLLASWNTSHVSVMNLHIGYKSSGIVTITMSTIDVPVRTQAYVLRRPS